MARPIAEFVILLCDAPQAAHMTPPRSTSFHARCFLTPPHSMPPAGPREPDRTEGSPPRGSRDARTRTSRPLWSTSHLALGISASVR